MTSSGRVVFSFLTHSGISPSGALAQIEPFEFVERKVHFGNRFRCAAYIVKTNKLAGTNWRQLMLEFEPTKEWQDESACGIYGPEIEYLSRGNIFLGQPELLNRERTNY